MNAKRQITIIFTLTVSLVFSGCRPGQLFGPTIAPTLTETLTSTATLTPAATPTLTATSTPTFTPTPECMATNRKWQSHELVDVGGVPSPVLRFDIQNCVIISWQFIVSRGGGVFGVYGGESTVPITNDQFIQDQDTDTGVITLEGFFDSSISSQGTVKLQDGNSIPWTASPFVP